MNLLALENETDGDRGDNILGSQEVSYSADLLQANRVSHSLYSEGKTLSGGAGL